MSAGFKLVEWNHHKRVYVSCVLVGIALFLAVFLSVSKTIWVGERAISDEILIIRALGTLALFLMHVILCIGPLARFDTRFNPLLYNRRHLGVITFFIALAHGLLVLGYYHGFGVMNPITSILFNTGNVRSIVAFPFEWFGIAALLIMLVMAVTSHDYWNARLGTMWWKTLHMGVYFAYALLILHVALGALQAEQHPAYPIVLGLGVVLVVGLHLAAAQREHLRDRALQKQLQDGWIDIGSMDGIAEGRAKTIMLPTLTDDGENANIENHATDTTGAGKRGGGGCGISGWGEVVCVDECVSSSGGSFGRGKNH